jgi:hypothetical protein
MAPGAVSPGRPAKRRSVIIGTVAVQLGDGSIDDGSKIECPKVWIDLGADDSLTPNQARGVARALLEAADEMDGWGQRNG